ncbi:MAG: LysR family transcriptional regulator [Myxococcota bacterium]
MDTTIQLLELRAFVAVVRSRTFTAAADVIGTDKAHVSRLVSRLEGKLDARLLQRSTRRSSLTETGRDFYERATSILGALEEAEASVARARGKPRGTLRLTAGVEYGMLRVNGWIAKYLRRHPEVQVDADLTNRVVDIIHEGIDVAIRVGALELSELSARKLGEIRYAFYASPAYLRRRKRPKTIADLERHDLIMFTPRGRPAWKVVRGSESAEVEIGTPRYHVNNNVAARDAARLGLGIALLPSFMAADAVRSGHLVVLLRGWERVPAPVYAVFPSSKYMAPKVRAFIDLAQEESTAECKPQSKPQFKSKSTRARS